MKKVLALVLAVVLCMGLGVVAFADATYADEKFTAKGTDDIVVYVGTEKDYDEEDLKATFDWEDGKEYFDDVDIEKTSANWYKVTVSFKGYYGTDDLDVDFDLGLKDGGRKADIKKATAGGENVLNVADKMVHVVATFGWDKADVSGDPDDSEVEIAGNAVIFDPDAKVTYTYFEFDAAEELTVEGKMSKQDAVNMYLDTAVTDEIKALMKKNEDVDFDVIDFRGAPEFDFTQEVTYYIDDEDVEYFVYEIVDGKPVAVKAKLNDDKDALVWKTRTLGTYIVTDDEIKAAAADETETDDKENPETGSASFVNVAVALGAVSLVAAGAVALKK